LSGHVNRDVADKNRDKGVADLGQMSRSANRVTATDLVSLFRQPDADRTVVHGGTSLTRATTVIIGAGPYGLSAAAHLKAAGVSTVVFGRPMEFWNGMPQGMFLKSPWSASSLSDPDRAFSLDRYARTLRIDRADPIPLNLFIEYTNWFRQRLVADVDPTYVANVRRNGAGFDLDLADGRRLTAGRVVVAVGIRAFKRVPEFADGLPAAVASHTVDHADFSGFKGRRVLVVGAGQSALESAALLHEAGADVEVLCRSHAHWVNRRFSQSPMPIRKLLYPPTDVGPPGINWLVAYPLVVRRLPERTRAALYRRATRPAGAKWLRPRVETRVKITQKSGIWRAVSSATGVRVELDDGTVREADHLLLGTGFRPDLKRLGFLEASLLAGIRQQGSMPVLNSWFESSVPNLHFIGGVASHSFGPLCNFVAGARVAARRVAARAS
jgi:cation diffusion facilitator CzcD-associated flavoprotein CzcO